jgi:DNA-binding transcriptional ArsR family regulator
MRSFLHPPPDELTLPAVLHALSDPARLMMFQRIVACEGMSCSQVCDVQPRSTLSFNLRVLREAGLIRSEKRGKTVLNAARWEELNQRFPGLLPAILDVAKAEGITPPERPAEQAPAA